MASGNPQLVQASLQSINLFEAINRLTTQLSKVTEKVGTTANLGKASLAGEALSAGGQANSVVRAISQSTRSITNAVVQAASNTSRILSTQGRFLAGIYHLLNRIAGRALGMASTPASMLAFLGRAHQFRVPSGPLTAGMASEGAFEAGAPAAAITSIAGVAAAIGAVVASALALVAIFKVWTEALNPGLIQILNQMLRNLSATLGFAVEPLFYAFTELANEAGGVLLPIMVALRPVFEMIADMMRQQAAAMEPLMETFKALIPLISTVVALVGVFMSFNNVIVSVIRVGLMPFMFILKLLNIAITGMGKVLQVVSAVFNGIGEVVNTVVQLWTVLIDTITEVIASFLPTIDLKDILKSVRDWFHQVVRALILFVATLAKTFGMNKFLANLEKSFAPKSGLQSTEATKISSLEQISKDLALSASIAGGAGSKETEEDWRAGILEEVKSIRSGLGQLGQMGEKVNKVASATEEIIRFISPMGDLGLRSLGRLF